MRIDAHQHFWQLQRDDYGWLTSALTPLYKDFNPQDLEPLLKAHGIDATVLVQAAPTVAETKFMLSLADDHDFIKGVVGWVDFNNTDVIHTLTELSQHTKLVGIRPMIQDITDVNWMLDDKFTPVYESLIQHNLVFDALTLPAHLSNLKKLITRHPELSIVIDHASKPDIKAGMWEPWSADMAELAETSKAYVKLSGLVTEAGADWTIEQLKPYVDHLLKHFGPERLLWGSDWPVCTLTSSYSQWCEATDQLLANVNTSEKNAILGQNAIQVYKLSNL